MIEWSKQQIAEHFGIDVSRLDQLELLYSNTWSGYEDWVFLAVFRNAAGYFLLDDRSSPYEEGPHVPEFYLEPTTEANALESMLRLEQWHEDGPG